MSYQLTFARMLAYDAGQPGITLAVTLKSGGEDVPCEAKIDTGSSFCVFARNIAEQLGLDVESGLRRVIGTVTGTFVIYLHEVSLSVAGFELDALIGFAADASFQRNVLGRRGFLEQVVLGLNDYEGKLYLSRYDEQ